MKIKLLKRDERGFIVSSELVLLATIAVVGLVTGLVSVRDAVVSEISDAAGAIQDLNQCYAYNGIAGHSASSCGSDFVDSTDWCDDADDTAGSADNCIGFDSAPTDERPGRAVVLGPVVVIGTPVKGLTPIKLVPIR